MKLLRGFLGIAVILAMITTLHAQSFLTNGLVAYYPFKGNANDSTGNGNNGTINGATLTTNMLGVANSAYYFNGSSYISVGSQSDLNFQGDFTVSAWCYCSGGSQKPRILSCGTGNGANSGYEICAFNNGPGSTFTVGVYIANTVFQTTNNFTLNTWIAVALVSQGGIGYLYVDGILQATVPHSSLTYSSGLNIGCNSQTGSDMWNGAITDVRLFNRPLSSNDVSALYSSETVLAPQLTEDLTNFFAVYGQNTTIGVTATSNTSATYQWYFSPSNGGGQAGAYAQTIAGFVYGAVVTNGGYGYRSKEH